jgi:arylformamidase
MGALSRFYDISVALSAHTPVYEGDTPVSIELTVEMNKGAPFNLSQITLGSHTGTHVDAPLHFLPQGASVDLLPLEVLCGQAQVKEFPNTTGALTINHLENADIPAGTERLLLKTRNSSLWESSKLRKDCVHIDSEAAQWLTEKGIRLIGIDYLSVDAFGSQGFPTHHILLKAGVIIVEGLDLSKVPEGEYTLICMPLKITGGDGAPARAMLMTSKA